MWRGRRDISGYGSEQKVEEENNEEWVKSSMRRLESRFGDETVKEIRMSCQCGYGMDEKLALVRELRSTAACQNQSHEHEYA